MEWSLRKRNSTPLNCEMSKRVFNGNNIQAQGKARQDKPLGQDEWSWTRDSNLSLVTDSPFQIFWVEGMDSRANYSS